MHFEIHLLIYQYSCVATASQDNMQLLFLCITQVGGDGPTQMALFPVFNTFAVNCIL